MIVPWASVYHVVGNNIGDVWMGFWTRTNIGSVNEPNFVNRYMHGEPPTQLSSEDSAKVWCLFCSFVVAMSGAPAALSMENKAVGIPIGCTLFLIAACIITYCGCDHIKNRNSKEVSASFSADIKKAPSYGATTNV